LILRIMVWHPIKFV